MDASVNWQTTGECTKTMLPDICPCEAKPRCDQLDCGIKFILPRIPPVCARPYCPGPFLAPPEDCSRRRHRCRPLPGPTLPRLADSLCPSKSNNVTSSGCNSGGSELMTSNRCDSAHWRGELKLTGYKTIGFAMAIPNYAGFKPRYPHPVPRLTRPGGCLPDYQPPKHNTYCCPAGCKLCTVVEKAQPALCVAQVHPYQAFNQVEKIIRTW